MSFYKFSKGNRLYVQARRQEDDPDHFHPLDEAIRIAEAMGNMDADTILTRRDVNTDVHGSTTETDRVERREGVKTVTRRVVRKTTTFTKAETSSFSENLMKHGSYEESFQGANEKRTVSYRNQSASYMTDALPKRSKISDIMVGQEESMTAREALLRWAQKTTAKYPGVRVGDFAGSWKDGLAFNAIIHRNRPDLIEWRSLRSRQVRDRLDSAFNVVEREYGVTRLLDPEDVDTPEPDEKSLITYISSLYDVFPEPPAIHPLYDPETQRKYTNYRELSKSLMSWIRHSIAVMQDRDFPPTLIEMKKLAAESARFHSDEVPTRLRDKLALFQMFKDIERFLEETGEYIEPELKPDVIERNWNQMLALHQERDGAIQEEIVRLERLQRIAEKVHRDAKQTEVKLGNLEQQIEEEARNVSRLHPADAKRHCDLISEDIDSLDDVIKSMFSDVQILKDGRHNQAAELHKRVQRIHQRWLSLRALYQSRLVTIISTLDESRTSRTTLETRLFETNEHFRHLRDCTEWVKTKLKQIDDAEYGTDLPGVQIELESYQKEQKAIERFSPSIERCSQARGNLNGEELQIYTTHLTYLLKWFSELQSKSTKRLTDLNILLDFIQSATSELIWLNEKEETEVNRDWSAKGLDLNEVEQYYEIGDPFSFWSQNDDVFPELADIALKHLSVPATSVPSESAFSIAGYFMRKQCARTTSKTLEKRMFLSDKFL